MLLITTPLWNTLLQSGLGRLSGDKRLTKKDVFATLPLHSQLKNVSTFEKQITKNCSPKKTRAQVLQNHITLVVETLWDPLTRPPAFFFPHVPLRVPRCKACRATRMSALRACEQHVDRSVAAPAGQMPHTITSIWTRYYTLKFKKG